MKKFALLGVIAAAGITSSLLAAPLTADALQATYLNPSATEWTGDFDIASATADNGESVITVAFVTENYEGPGFTAELVIGDSAFLDESHEAVQVTAVSPTGDAPSISETRTSGGATQAGTTDGVHVTRDVATGVFIFSIPAAHVTWTGPIGVSATIVRADGETAWFGITFGSKRAGVGFPERGATKTRTFLSVGRQTQVNGVQQTPIYVSVSPKSASGTVQVLEGDTVVASASASESVPQSASAPFGRITLGVPQKTAWGAHTYVARFVPDDAEIFAPSTSEPFTFTLISYAEATTTALSFSKASQAFGMGSAVVYVRVWEGEEGKLNYGWGTVTIFDGNTPLTTVPVEYGSAEYYLPNNLSEGEHLIRAAFTSKNAERQTNSASAAVPYLVTAAPSVTTTKVALSRATQKVGKKPAKVTVTVSGKAVGSVTIFDGKKKLKTVTLKGGKATYTLSKTLKKGKHTIKAVFTPTNVEAFKTSKSKSVKLTVKK